ncbi:hypothetical protein GCM10010295_14080 [Streptomyces intermedius]
MVPAKASTATTAPGRVVVCEAAMGVLLGGRGEGGEAMCIVHIECIVHATCVLHAHETMPAERGAGVRRRSQG